jgi:GTP-binding protein
VHFLDEAEIVVASGAGGRGSSSFRREKFVPHGGPDGGDGGRGGHVILQATAALNTLGELRHRPHWRAGPGEHGGFRRRTGADGQDLVIPLPVGTIVREAGTGLVLFELMRDGEGRIVAEGGGGGLGNVHFKSSTNRAPRQTTPGGPAVEMRLKLELKLVADVGLVGLPNAGKSTLIAAVSAARPKVADYPFTTLVPHLGVVRSGDAEFVVADIPGLIEGAAEGRGLGHRFLRHIERTRLMLHLLALDEADIEANYLAIRRELGRFDPDLLRRPELILLTKADLAGPEAVADARARLAAHGEVLVVAAATGQGLASLVQRVWERLADPRPDPRV